MTDIVSAATRSRMMAGIKGENTKPEVLVRKALFAAGFRFRLHRRDLPGKPDIVLAGRRIAIFVHGCFWHKHAHCAYFKMPATRTQFWEAKFAGNIARDRRAQSQLAEAGWRVLVVWECAIRNEEIRAALPELLNSWIQGKEISGNLSGSGVTA